MQIKEIIDRINDDIVEVLSHYVELKKNGHNYLGLCPFHPEKTPRLPLLRRRGSLNVSGVVKAEMLLTLLRNMKELNFWKPLKSRRQNWESISPGKRIRILTSGSISTRKLCILFVIPL